jgi:DNA-binding NtrC family response regulator
VLLLADAFIRRFSERHGRNIRGLDPAARRALESYSFPGNVRELENVLERAVILEDGVAITAGSLPDEIIHFANSAPRPPSEARAADEPAADRATQKIEPIHPDLRLIDGAGPILPFSEVERRVVLDALEKTGWNIQEASTKLGIGRATIYRMMRRHGIERGND